MSDREDFSATTENTVSGFGKDSHIENPNGFEDGSQPDSKNNPTVDNQGVTYSDVTPHKLVGSNKTSQYSDSSSLSANKSSMADAVGDREQKKKDEKDENEKEGKEDKLNEQEQSSSAVDNDPSLEVSESDASGEIWGTLSESVDQVEDGVQAAEATTSSSSILGWTAAIAAVGAGIAASSGGDNSAPEAPSLSLDDDTGLDGDGISSVAVISVSGLTQSASWEYSLDGGSSWQAGQGSSFTIDVDGDYSLLARQSIESQTSDASNALAITLDTASPTLGDNLSLVIDESSGANQVIYTAAADADGTSDASFSLADGSDVALSIDADSGAVTLSTDPDHETQDSYSFTVVAADAAGNVSEGQTVDLSVVDLDEVGPVITSGATSSAIDENSGAAQVIYTAIADDSADISGGVSFSLAGGSDAALSIDAETGVVTLSTDPDHETQDSYSFTVVATDAAGNASEQAVTMGVNNLDEIAPSLVSNEDKAIDENGGANQVVYTITADDSGDISDGVSFSLTNDSDSSLSVDASTGDVYLSRNPNYEGQSSYQFTAIATDAAGNVSANQTVSISILNVDEVAPFITSRSSANAISENSGASQVVYVATADDSLDVSNGVAFSLSESSDQGLIIDSETGEVTLNNNPDYESQDSYSFTVVATDAAGNASFGKNVTLAISNLDDSTPLITSAVSATPVNENSGAAQVIYTATADDSADISGGVSFSLAGGSDAALSIDADTGVVTLSTDPDHETQESYSFTVVATDAAGNASEQAVTAGVNDLDEVAPSITSGDTAAAIDENSGAAQVIYTATADDSADISGGVSFSLAESSDAALSIDANTGVVTLSTDPDHETQNSYSFTVLVTDAAGNASEQAVTMGVNDLDEVAPSITSGATATAIDENSGAAQVIYTATADDSVDVSGGVTFSLAEDSDAALSIDADTGVVTLSTDPDYEAQDTYNFTVVATDAAGNASEKAVTMGVNDLDEVAPSITSGDTAAAIDENSGAAQVIYTATADDSADVSGGVTFSLAEDSDAALSVDAETGVVTLTTGPDHETQESYSFTVVATDAAGNASEQAVTLGIDDLDDTAPVITSGDTAPVIDENSGANQVIYTVTSDDSVDVSSGVTTYSLAAGSDAALSINASTGAVTLSSDPDHETQDSYSFTVVATDAASNVSEQAVTMGINNLDDTAPTITSGDTATAIDENSGADQVIYTATADDSADVSDGATTYSLAEGSDAALSIDADTGAVILSTDPDYETQDSYSFTVVATDAAGNASEQFVTLEINDLDEIPPVLLSIDTVVADQTIILKYDEALSETIVPGIADFAVQQNGVEFNINSVSIIGDSVILGLTSAPASGPLQVTYTGDSIQDIAGNVGPQFTQIIASDGYLRGVEIYADDNNDGIPDPDELLEGVTSNAEGEIILEGDLASSNLIIISGVNVDTGAVNEFSLSAPAGYSVVNPLTTLVSSIINNTAGATSTEDAEALVIESLGLELGDGGAGLSGYDPISDQSEDALANRVVTAQVASILAVAASSGEGEAASEAAQQAVLNNLVATVETAAPLVLDSESVAELLTSADGDSLVDVELLAELGSAVDQLSEVDSLDAIVSIQAALTDKIAPDAPILDLSDATDTGIKGDAITAQVSPTVRVSFEVGAIDGTALVVGDTIRFWGGEISEDSPLNIQISQDDLDNGYIDFPIAELAEGLSTFSSYVTDIAGNESEFTVWSVRVDTTPPEITSADMAAAIDENSGAGQVIYTAQATDVGGGVTFNLAEDSDAAFSIDADTGEVTLGTDPDHETQSSYSFTVVATDAAGNVSEGQPVSLTINDLDDTAPTITSGKTATAIEENSGADQVIYTVTSDDSADVSEGVTSYSLSEDSDAALSIDVDTGEVTLSTDPDHETQSSYSFTVVVTDSAGNASEQAVTLGINNLDDTAPLITSGDTAVAIDENSGADQVIYTVTADDSADSSDGVSFSLAKGSDAALSIDANTGAVTLSSDPDHETQDAYSFTVVATDAAGNVSEGLPVSLTINDLDDTAPTITSGTTATIIDENSGADQVIYTVTADDSADVSEGVTSYSLTEDSDAALSIDVDTGEVTLSTDPDHETQSSYSFTVVGTDAAGNASEQAVTLGINNLDDTAPLITSGDTAVAIDENSGADQVIYTVTADDSADSSDGVSFSLAEGSDAALSIDANTGAVTLSSDPDHETQDTYSFTVVAIDAAGNASESQSVTLLISDLDDTAPVITSADSTPALNENSGADQVIYTATSEDSADVGDGVTTYSLAEGSDTALSIDANTGAVTLSSDPDHETQPEYSFTVLATDAAGNVNEQELTLGVDNLDEIAPIINSDTTSLIAENSGGAQVVYLATADDSLDVSEGVVFSLAAFSDGSLSIDPNSGAVTLASDPDYETQSTYSFGVVATDLAGNVSESLPVVLSIGNEDESRPLITSPETFLAVQNSGAGRVVYTAASDDSGDISEGVTYSLAGNSDPALSIDGMTGQVTLADNPDSDIQSEYAMTIIAADAAGLIDIKDVTLIVDSAPLITSSLTPVVSENLAANTIVYTVSASDAENPDGQITFSFGSVTDDRLSINSLTGEVTLSEATDFEVASDYRFMIKAADESGNASEQLVTLSVSNLDELAPTITSGATATAIDENSGADQVIYTATADDSADVSGGVTFSLADGSDAALSIDPGTGAVTLSTDPDHEAQDAFSFTVVATDAAGNASEQAVTMGVNDLDEVTPSITSGATATAIDENSGADQVIYTATADDSADISGGVTFSLAEGSDPALSIDPGTGAVTLSTDPHHEAQDAFSFTVVATDAAGNASEQAVTMGVNDLDEVAPSITSGDTATAIDENSGAAQVIYTATADDSADISGGVTFSLAEGSDAALSIDTATGEVTLSTDPDHEVQDAYSFTVVATDAAGNVSEQAVTMGINNLDDTAPTVTSGDTATAIDENSGADQVIYTATADDSADISGGVTFSLAEGSDAALSIDADTGVVTLTTDPDHETQDSYNFTVVATDAAGNVSEQAVTMGINNLDDTAPTITSGDTATAIDENSGADQVIYTATADDSADISGGVTFSLAEGSDAALSIDTSTGEVALSTDPDHETQDSYSFTVVATDAAGNVSEQAVTMGINNLDDTAPTITSGDTATAIDESSGAEQVIYTATADDSADISGGVTFSLAEGSDAALSIDTSTGEVALSADPDHETQDSYSFTVVATDAAGNVSEQAVTMGVNNLDDTAPTITSGDTATAIDENSGTDQVIYTATADDSADVSGGVTFSLAEGSDAVLSIDADTGVVTLSTDPDHETQESYSFTVVATDAAGNASEQAVTLGIDDLDDTAPVITSGDTAPAIDENSSADQVIYTATGDDSADVSGGVTFSLAAGSDAALSINASTGAVTLSIDPDHETQDSYSFTVVATDTAGNVSEQAVTMGINNLDDTAPTITSGDTATAIDENSGADQVIYTATADDSADVSGGVTFSLVEDSDAVLSIDADTGVVTLTTDPDHETQSAYDFTVVATDVVGNAREQAVTLGINDLDDTAPVITSGDTAPAIDESSGADQVIYTATADDSADVSDGVTFSLAEGSDAALSIDMATGAVTLSTDPDHETQDSYNFTVVATDAAGNASEQAVTMGVNDLDEVAPSITSSDTATAIDENSGADQVIYTATADDYADISGGVTFSLAEGSDAALSIDTATGEVTLSTDPDHETQNSYSFTVLVTDAAGNVSEQTATMGINNLDDTAPTVTSGDTATAIDENSGADQVIYTATADDSTDISGGVTFSLAEGSDAALTIDTASGEVALSTDPDHETQDSYSFTVVATDAAGNASEQAVTMGVNDLDEVAPSITSGDTAAAIDENSGAAQVIYTATADDSADVSGGVTFSLAEDSDAVLSIDADTGVVTLSTDPDHETQESYSFTVVATDAAGNASEQAVTMGVNDLDEVAPSITSGDTAAAIDENSGAAQVIYTATADDSADVSDGVTFSLAEDSDAVLSIDADTGVVTLSTDPDHETQESYSFAVVATDAAGNASEKAVTMGVNDLDEVAPSITSGDTATAIDENSGADQVIYTATADDSADVSGGVTFSLAEDSDAVLSIDADTGVVTLSTDPDHETQESYSFTVVATDAAGNASEQAVTMGVNDLDEVAPSITSGDTAAAIDENSGAAQVIYTATADDSADVSGGVTFSLAEDSDAVLSIDADTGVVTLSTDPDHETQESYSFTVVATDAAGNASEQAVTMGVNDLDEVAPSITSGDTATAIDENSGTDQVIYTATADDSADVSGGVTFSLAEDSDAALSIDADTGVVTLTTDPDHETQESYSFTVVATDAAGNASEQAVTMGVNDLDEVAPSITSGDTAAAIDENSGAAQVIYTATADDSADVSDGVTFSLAEDSDAVLSIDADTGVVTLSTDPDHETQESYSFAVVATDAAGNASEKAVTMGVNDLDEVAPSITSGDTAAAIDENSGAAQVIYTATADDSADVSDGVTFSLAEDSDAVLSIDADTGVVTLSTDPDHETQESYSFAVVATDAAGNSSEKAVTMGVNDLDEVAPSITSGDTATAIDENSGADQVIYTATADDSADISGGVTFSLVEDSDAVLSIDADTGVVTLTTDPDHETQSAYDFTVVATDVVGNAREQAVTLGINDLDDTAPVITSGDTAPAIDENSGADQVIYTATADDSADVSDGVTFSLAEGSDAALSIDTATGAVTLSTDPDHETQDSYNFTVVATDAAGNASEQAVTMGVNDLDEVAPSITSGDTATAIDENSGADQVIYAATADDSADVSGGVTFSLAEDSDAVLSIDADTGVVTLSTDPDHETQESYSFTVVATDAAGNASEQAVTMGVNDLDEVAPSITSGDTAAAIDENSGAAQVIYTATADDSADVSDGVTFSLAEDSDAVLSIDADTGVVTLSTDPDHETQESYSFAVVATDAAGNASEKAVTMGINNLDDTAPTITSGDTATAIDENSGADQVIYTATADDSADVSGGVTFSLAEDSDAVLSIDADTGVVTLSTDPDHETQESYSFTVVATDAAGNASEQAVTMGVNDLDEVAPSITSGDTAAAIDENSGAAQVIYTATADDSADVSDGVTFSLAEDSDAVLSIDADTGVVTLSTDPDHETQESYSFAVVATDAAGNASEKAVTMGVNDLDEVAPSITSGDTAAAIDENSGAAQVIYTATADDSADVSDGVTFSLAEDSDAVLSIDADTGVVTLSTDPDHETQESYSFAVVATDAAGNSSEKAVTMGVNDLDEVAPSITSGDTATAIDENSGADQVIYTATADDSADISGGVTFSLVEDSDAVLSIDADTGVVTLTTDPDHETQSAYDFTVVATDVVGNAREQAVTLGINDLDDTAPVITSGDTAPAIDENSGADQVIYTATADDSADVSDGVTFSLAEGSDAALSIDTATGAVTLSTDPDHETQDSYNFTVVATDAAGNASEQAVTMGVNDLDEVAPSITSGDTATAIDENSGADQVIYTATADDSADISGGVTFSLAEGSDAALSIDTATGEVTLSTDPDHETQNLYSFTVLVTDAAGNASEKAVTMGVNDLDEVAPSITSGATATSIDENSGTDQVIYTATADDSADVSDGVTFSLAEGSDAVLSIDAETGVVTLSTDPDHETQESYSFAVVATDAAGNASEKAVTMGVNDLDEVAPSITSGDTATAIDENSGADQVIYTATADDSADVSGGVTFSLAEDSDAVLSIDADTGVVTLSTDPDHETQESYSFTVVATDAAGNASEQAVTMGVNDLDEVAPSITSGDTAAAIDENSGADQVIYTATADDSADVSGGVTFSLAEDSDAALSIDAETGVVTLTTDPDHETQNSYSFTVLVTDAAGNAREQAVTLGINDLDDTAPVITSGDTAPVIDENSGANQVIYTVTSDDSVDVSSGVATYSLTAGSDAALSINASTGAVTLSSDPDHETQDSYSFTVVATDTTGNVSEQAVTMGVNDLDDTAPVIDSESSVSVSDFREVLYSASADDSADISDGVTYSLGSRSSDDLTINSTSGEVRLVGSVTNYSSIDSYTFTVLATDFAGNSSQKEVSVSVTEPVSIEGPGVVSAGALVPTLTRNDAGALELAISLNDSLLDGYANGVGNYEFSVKYDVAELGAIGDSQLSWPSDVNLGLPNTTQDGEVFFGGLSLFGASVDQPLLTITFPQTEIISATLEITKVAVGLDQLQSSSYVVSSFASSLFQGTDDSESFLLNGGEAVVAGGAGPDVFVLNQNSGSSITISDFSGGEDTIELSSLATSYGYQDIGGGSQPATDDILTKYDVGSQGDIATLIQSNDSALDNVFGAFLIEGDDGSDVLTVFIDASSDAGEVDIETYELTLPDDSKADDDDVTVSSYSFIA